jgi:hypothetical protein
MSQRETENQATELHILNTHRGHKRAKESITIESSVNDRKTLANKVKALLRDGYTIMADGRRIVGYDPKTNEWITKAVRKPTEKKKKKMERIPAKGTTANAVAPISGG